MAPPLQRVDKYVWKIPQTYRSGMRVPVIVYASEKLIQKMQQDRTLEQAVNVSMLPGVQKHVTVLPDAHEGYGFPIGGVAAMDVETGVISPGGIGYDINCGVRLMVTNLSVDEVRPRIKELVDTIFANVPAGLGSRRKDFNVTHSDLDKIVVEGARYIIERYGLGWDEDYKHMEESGAIQGADPSVVSPTAKSRGQAQIGTLGSGNHFLEVQRVDKIFDERAAKIMGITHEGQVTVLIHCGSRGYGHQICSDYLRVMERGAVKYGIRLPDRELACVPIKSNEAQQYLKAFKCAVNFAFANRQAISHWVRQSFQKVFRRDPEDLGMKIVYDVCHNIAKFEKHKVNGGAKEVLVHRKGATRSFPAGHQLIPEDYRAIGQPVLIPGSMGTASWVLLGNPNAMELSFGSTAHGAGREMSRAGAKRRYRGDQVIRDLESRGVYVRGDSMATIVEEVDAAYKSVDEVVEVSHQVGIGTKVARLVPIGVVKG
ncbi:MAG TPA: RtcB family protein [Candidatus Caldiarchaeum subterraneum]|uniref:tRNA-splicing ligase RtcB n=1 Tax=Caldiarchaeum subterraneum TaxID=311458 RepID=A0A833A4S9_CALS0|nr:RtcB family protein [Candidatus Caldarchaeum subterraneum]